jgi:EmrB/QacA subfamily drug resistance transporter
MRDARWAALPERHLEAEDGHDLDMTDAAPAVAQTAWRGRRRVLALLATTQFLLILDSAIVNVALASIGGDLHVPAGTLTWVVNGYVLAFGGLLLLGGRLADIAGARRVLVAGVATFALSSLAGAVAQGAAWLITARVVQGAGASLAGPAVLGLVMRHFRDDTQRASALGVIAAMAGAGGAAGLVLGGTLTQWFGWRAVLFINVPVSVVLVASALVLVPGDRPARGGTRFDLLGAVTVTAGLSALVYAVLGAGTAGWTSPRTLMAAAASGALLAAFAVVENRASAPLVPWGFLRHPAVRAGNPVAALLSAAMFPMWFLLAMFDQRALGFTPLRTGLAILPLVGVLVVANTVAPRLLAHVRPRVLVAVGLLVAAAGLAWMSRASIDAGWVDGLLVPSLVTGAGFGVSFVPLMAVATADVPPDKSGLASGIVNVAQQLGGAVGLAALMSVATSSSGGTADGYATGLLGAAAFAFAGAVVTTLLPAGDRSWAARSAPSVLHAPRRQPC